MKIQVYADEHGIGFFDEGWHDSGEPGPADLRLDDVKTFLAFAYELLVMAVDRGWFPLDGALMKKWEYKVIRDPANNPGRKQKALNILGEQGWELVCVDAGWHLFKRESNDVPSCICNDDCPANCKGKCGCSVCKAAYMFFLTVNELNE